MPVTLQPDILKYKNSNGNYQGIDTLKGDSAYVYIRYASVQPTQDSDMKTTPDAWMGIYSGDAATAPTAYTEYTWYNIKGQAGPVQDVQVNGVSVLQDGVANVPVADAWKYGAVMVSGYGLAMQSNGYISTKTSTSSEIKNGQRSWEHISPSNQHQAAFYGLAKAAGDTTQSASSNAVGAYTEDAKSKISEMLNGSVSVSGSTPTITAKSGIRYVCGEVSTLDITLPASGIVDVVFESGSTPTVLTVTSEKSGVTAIKWAGGWDGTCEASTTYEINILDGEYGVVASWT